MLVNLNKKGLFGGLYENIWVDSEALHSYDESIDIDLLILDTKGYLSDIAELYRYKLASVLNVSPQSIRVYETYSPRFYNFETDTIVLDLLDKETEKRFNDFIENEDLEFFEIDLFFENIELYFENCK